LAELTLSVGDVAYTCVILALVARIQNLDVGLGLSGSFKMASAERLDPRDKPEDDGRKESNARKRP